MQTRLDLYQKVTPLAGLGIWEYNLSTGDIYWNTIMWQIYEMPPQPTPPHKQINALYRDETVLNQLVMDTIKTLIPQTGEFRVTTYLGNQRWVKLRIHAVGNNEGCSQLYGTLENITEAKALEEERKATLELLSQQNSRLTNFAHIVSHNLRTHTGNIKMLAELVPQETDEAEKKAMQDMLIRQTSSLLETLNQLNEVVDVNSRSFDKIEELNLLQALQQVLTALEQPILKHDVQVEISIDPEIVVEHKAAYLESILSNLISNAIKYRSPVIPCKITIHASPEPSGGIKMEVRDNGMGIDLHRHQSRLFGLYNTFHGNADAQGVGLYLVKSQLEALGGFIEVESEPDQGTQFYIYFK